MVIRGQRDIKAPMMFLNILTLANQWLRCQLHPGHSVRDNVIITQLWDQTQTDQTLILQRSWDPGSRQSHPGKLRLQLSNDPRVTRVRQTVHCSVRPGSDRFPGDNWPQLVRERINKGHYGSDGRLEALRPGWGDSDRVTDVIMSRPNEGLQTWGQGTGPKVCLRRAITREDNS